MDRKVWRGYQNDYTNESITARFINGTAFKPSDWGDSGLPIVRITQLTGGGFDNYFDGEVSNRYLIENGTLLFSWSATLDSFEWDRGPAILNQHIFKVIANLETYQRFLYFSLKHHAPLWADIDAHGSTMRHIKKESLGNKIWLPDPETQKEIADFLDCETARIDQLIEKKQRQVDTLQGKISGLADHVVSSGLDQGVEQVGTGIPWLPEIPGHWKLERAKFLYREAQRPPLDNDKIITAFRDGQVTLRENRRSRGFTLAIKEVGYQHICGGDLVIHTMDAFAGAIGVSDSNGKATGEYAVCEARSDRVNNQYYALLLRTMAKRNYIYILCPSVRERAPRFRFVRFATVLLPVPPRHGQDQIVAHIETMTVKMAVLRNKVQASIDRLKEFRAALITNAVTGQIDVAIWGKKDQAERRIDALEEEAVS